MLAFPQPLSLKHLQSEDLPTGEMSSDATPLNPALKGFSVPYVGDEPDYSEHIVNSGSVAWTDNTVKGKSCREDPLSGEISLGHIASSFHIPLFSWVR